MGMSELYRIQRSDFVNGAAAAEGLVIVIDVFRACSLVAVALSRGAARVVPVAAVADALQLKAAHPDWLLLGERHAKPLPGFEGGNSPSELLERDLTDQTIIHTTHAGTQGLTAAYARAATPSARPRVFTGALVNASATVHCVLDLLRRGDADGVTVVAMGQSGTERCVEDDLCADYMMALLRGKTMPIDSMRQQLRASPSAAKFFDPAATWAPQADFDICSSTDSLHFAVGMTAAADGLGSLRKIG